MANANLKALFNLPADEDFFDDFKCKEGFGGSGRLYLTSGHICYFSSLLGITKNIVISWDNIKGLSGDQKQGIKVHKDNGDSVLFSGFGDRDTSLKFIKRLWNNNSKYGNDLLITQDEDDEDDEADKLLEQAA